MRKIISVLLILITTVCLTYAISPSSGLISRDSMRTKWANGKKFLMHKVQKGETFYSISRDYKVDVKELMNANKGVTSLKAGQIIQVPVAENYTATAKQEEEVEKIQSQEPLEDAPAVVTEMPQRKTITSNVYHTVKKGETLSGISKKYNMPYKEISEMNNLKNNQIQIGKKLIVKKGNETIINSDAKSVPSKTSDKIITEQKQTPATLADVTYVVKKGETLYGISKKYGVSSNELIAWNDLKGNGVKVGQQLIVKKGAAAAATEMVRNKTTDESNIDAPKTAEVEKKVNDVKEETAAEKEAVKNEKPVKEIPQSSSAEIIDKTPSGKNIKQSIETGEAAWVNDGDLNSNKYFALHRSAPIGTIMKVTNRMNGKYVFVKVIGKLPGTGDNERLIIKISKAAADRLGVLDQTFQCELNYAFASE